MGKRKKYGDEPPGSRSELRDRLRKKMKQISGQDSLLSKPLNPLPPAVRGHPIHPAYRNRYTKSNCPMCLVEAAMESLKRSQDIAFANDGPGCWKKVTKGAEIYPSYGATMVGGR